MQRPRSVTKFPPALEIVYGPTKLSVDVKTALVGPIELDVVLVKIVEWKTLQLAASTGAGNEHASNNTSQGTVLRLIHIWVSTKHSCANRDSYVEHSRLYDCTEIPSSQKQYLCASVSDCTMRSCRSDVVDVVEERRKRSIASNRCLLRIGPVGERRSLDRNRGVAAVGGAKLNFRLGSLPVGQRFHGKPCLNSFVVRRTIASDPPQTLPATLTDLDQRTITERDRAHQVHHARQDLECCKPSRPQCVAYDGGDAAGPNAHGRVARGDAEQIRRQPLKHSPRALYRGSSRCPAVALSAARGTR